MRVLIDATAVAKLLAFLLYGKGEPDARPCDYTVTCSFSKYNPS